MPTVADEEFKPEFKLKLFYLLRKSALRNVEMFRRYRKIEIFGTLYKIFKLSQFHIGTIAQ